VAAGSTYSTIATTTLGSATNQVNFSSISNSYTDIFISGSYKLDADDLPLIVVGTGGTIDTGNNYSYTYIRGSGSSATSGRASNAARVFVSYSNLGWANFQIHLMNYSNTTTYKSILTRGNDATDNGTLSYVGLWRNTGAINIISLRVGGSNFQAGSTFTLYGIASA
jgi:hypothetical protein